MSNALHSDETCEWGTPLAVVELARAVLGGLDLDSCSSPYWNYWTVKATRYFDAEHSVLERQLSGRVFCNPPGGKVPGTQRSLPKAVWEHHVDAWRRGAVDGVVWVGYSLEQLVMLQGSPAHPLQFVTCVPCERLAFLQNVAGGPMPGKQPTHGNYISLLPSVRNKAEARAQMTRFRDLGASLGAVTRPLT